MKNKVFIGLMVLATAMTSCGSYNASVYTGAVLGGVLGAVIGDNLDSYHGANIGSSIGMIAGGAAGEAMYNSRQKKKVEESVYTPSFLQVTNLRFIDENRNHVIDASEECKLVFEIVNNSDLPVYNVVPTVEEVTEMKHIGISSSVKIGRIEPGNRVRYTATIKGKKRLDDGEATFSVYVTDANGAISDAREFSLPTAKRHR